MKRWIAALLTLLLLAQALPLNALAAAGHVLTEAELAAAYALTGFGGHAQANGAYHKGMTPNETWNAMQVSDWLDEVLGTNMYSVEDILSRASVKLADLREQDLEAYAYFTEDSSFKGVVRRVQEMYGAAEEMRQEMRYQRDRIKEQAGLIAEYGRQLKEGGESVFASDRARLSAKIEAATAELKAARREVADNAGQWEAQIDAMQRQLDTDWRGAGGDDSPQTMVGDWISQLYAYGDDRFIENTAPVNVVNASSSRMGRLSSNDSVLSNDAVSQIHVMSENEIGIQLYTGKYDDKEFIRNVKVTVADLKNKEKSALEGYTDEKGRVFFETSKFVVDDEKTVHIKLDVEANQRGYRDFGVEHAIFKLGELRKEPLTPLDDRAYVYSASFKDYDILRSDFEMLYSDMNDMEFDIKVVVRTPDNSAAPAPMFCYWKNRDFDLNYYPQWVSPDTRSGNTFVFRGQWKRELKPFIAKNETPFFAFSKDDSAERFKARVKSLKGAVDAPVDKGGKIFNEVLGEGLSLKVKIPGVNIDGSLDLPFKKMLPNIQIDPAGFVTISMGSELLKDEMKKNKLNWKNQEMADLAKTQKDNEKTGAYAHYMSQYNVAYEYYTENRLAFLMESKIKVGWFGLLSGRWQIDNKDRDVKLTVIKLRGAFGLTLKYSFSWTMKFTIGPVPVYIALTLAIAAGASFGIQAGFSWVNGAFHDWQLQPVKDAVFNLGFTFIAQAGVGIKGYLDLKEHRRRRGAAV